MRNAVYLAWYHDGFTDNSETLLCVGETEAIAASAIGAHKERRNRDDEYKDKATWRVEAHPLISAPVVNPVVCNKCGWGGEEDDLIVCTDAEDGEICKGCPVCFTDHYLMDRQGE